MIGSLQLKYLYGKTSSWENLSHLYYKKALIFNTQTAPRNKRKMNKNKKKITLKNLNMKFTERERNTRKIFKYNL